MPTKFSINPNITQAETLSSEFYQNSEIFIDCKEKIFTPSWQFITHSATFNDHTIFPFSFLKAGINARYDEQHSIGKRYRRHDEAGTPYCITIDGQSTEDGTVTIRDRDTMEQERISKDEALQVVQKRLIES